jgi:hypothetical protein
MPKQQYVKKNFGQSSLDIIEAANRIIEDYQSQGYKLTLRQLYYRFIANDLFPDSWADPSSGTKNTMKNYKHLGDIINDGRLAGLIDWEAIEDRTRNVRSLAHWNSPSEILEACSTQYRRDKWEDQVYRPRIWIEKDALVGVIEGICTEHDVPFFSCRGYTSQSEMWSAAQAIQREIDAGYTPIIFHFGDHDPSGIDMTRDITDRIEMFMGGIEVRRLALNMNQINEFSPPPSPAKITDSRATAYIAQYGGDSWELDALEPSVLVGLVEGAILSVKDMTKWAKSLKKEKTEQNKIKKLARTL